jgi:hypothetical protein
LETITNDTHATTTEKLNPKVAIRRRMRHHDIFKAVIHRIIDVLSPWPKITIALELVINTTAPQDRLVLATTHAVPARLFAVKEASLAEPVPLPEVRWPTCAECSLQR